MKQSKRLISALLLCCLFLGMGTTAEAKPKKTEEKKTMIWYDMVNASHYGNMSVKVGSGYITGSKGSAFIYVPLGYKEAYKTHFDNAAYSGKVIQATMDDLYRRKAERTYGHKIMSAEVPNNVPFPEHARQIYYQGGYLYMQSYSRIERLLADRDTLEKWANDGTTSLGNSDFECVSDEPPGWQSIRKNYEYRHFGLLVSFIDGKVYYFGGSPLNLYAYNLVTGKTEILATFDKAKRPKTLATDGENLYFYVDYVKDDYAKAIDTTGLPQAYVYSIRAKTLKEDKDAPNVVVKAPEHIVDDKYAFSDASAMRIVKDRATKQGWTQIEKQWKNMASWYVYRDTLYFQSKEPDKVQKYNRFEMRAWHSIDIKTGKMKKNEKSSPYTDNMVINTIDGLRVILYEGWSEITNLNKSDWTEQYVQNQGLAVPTPD